MQGHYTKSKVIRVSIPEPAHRQLQKLAHETGRTVPGYVRYLIIQEFKHLGLPLHITASSKKEQADL